jgi:hypothetical protein
MWFYPLLLLLAILALAGGILLGGVFTIILVPIAFIVFVSAGVYTLWGRALAGAGGESSYATPVNRRPLPHRRARPSGRSRSTPDRLVDARRREQ